MEKMICPKCKQNDKVTFAGSKNNRTRFRCQSCRYHYSTDILREDLNVENKRIAMVLYTYGFSSRATAKIIRVSNVTVSGWVGRYDSIIKDNRKTEKLNESSKEELQKFLESYPNGNNFLILNLEQGIPLLYKKT